MTPDPSTDVVQNLTSKERECLRLVLDNRSSKEIARRLGISHTSVDTHIRRARAKLGLRDRHEAAVLLDRWEHDTDGAVALAATPAGPVFPAAASGGLLAPLAALGPLPRLGLILPAALFLALVFALGANVLQRL